MRLEQYKRLDDASVATSDNSHFEEKAIELEAVVVGLKS
jgi:hypothetical protein